MSGTDRRFLRDMETEGRPVDLNLVLNGLGSQWRAGHTA